MGLWTVQTESGGKSRVFSSVDFFSNSQAGVGSGCSVWREGIEAPIWHEIPCSAVSRQLGSNCQTQENICNCLQAWNMTFFNFITLSRSQFGLWTPAAEWCEAILGLWESELGALIVSCCLLYHLRCVRWSSKIHSLCPPPQDAIPRQ